MKIADIKPGTYYIADRQKVFKGELETISCYLTMPEECDEDDFDTQEELNEAIAHEMKLVEDQPIIATIKFSNKDWRGNDVTVIKAAEDGISLEGIFTTKEELLNYLSETL